MISLLVSKKGTWNRERVALESGVVAEYRGRMLRITGSSNRQHFRCSMSSFR
jgi:hypothetical protein